VPRSVTLAWLLQFRAEHAGRRFVWTADEFLSPSSASASLAAIAASGPLLSPPAIFPERASADRYTTAHHRLLQRARRPRMDNGREKEKELAIAARIRQTKNAFLVVL